VANLGKTGFPKSVLQNASPEKLEAQGPCRKGAAPNSLVGNFAVSNTLPTLNVNQPLA